jgi:hypothetical protein
MPQRDVLLIDVASHHQGVPAHVCVEDVQAAPPEQYSKRKARGLHVARRTARACSNFSSSLILLKRGDVSSASQMRLCSRSHTVCMPVRIGCSPERPSPATKRCTPLNLSVVTGSRPPGDDLRRQPVGSRPTSCTQRPRLDAGVAYFVFGDPA